MEIFHCGFEEAADNDYDQWPDRWTRRIPLGRIADPEDVARLALFLASDDSAYISGAEVTIDGGMQ